MAFEDEGIARSLTKILQDVAPPNSVAPTGGFGLTLDENGRIPQAAVLAEYTGTAGTLQVDATGAVSWGASGMTVATTVAGLGTAADGKMGMIRAGSTPFEFVQVVYDGTYAKWVSSEVLIYDAGANVPSANATSENDLGPVGQHKWKVMNTAGLYPQFRATGFIGKTSAGANSDMSLLMQMASSDESATEGATGAYTTSFGNVTKTITASNVVAYDTGWTAPGTYPTVGDHLTLKLRYNNTDASDAKVWRYLRIYLRWIS